MPGIPSSETSSNPLFRPFTWHDVDVPPSNHKVLAEYTHDIGNGIATLLALIEHHESEALDGRPFFSALDKGTLLRLAISSSKMLAHLSYIQISEANTIQRKKISEFVL